MKRRSRDRQIALIARLVIGAAGVVAGLLFLRSLPDLVRYVKLERM